MDLYEVDLHLDIKVRGPSDLIPSIPPPSLKTNLGLLRPQLSAISKDGATTLLLAAGVGIPKVQEA